MEELFKEIIIGKKNISELESVQFQMNKNVQKTTEVSELFLNTSIKKYQTGELAKEQLNDYLIAYGQLLTTNDEIGDYINASRKNDASLEKINHIINRFADKYLEKPQKDRQFVKSLFHREIKTNGFVEPALLGLITFGSGLIFLANLYLNI